MAAWRNSRNLTAAWRMLAAVYRNPSSLADSAPQRRRLSNDGVTTQRGALQQTRRSDRAVTRRHAGRCFLRRLGTKSSAAAMNQRFAFSPVKINPDRSALDAWRIHSVSARRAIRASAAPSCSPVRGLCRKPSMPASRVRDASWLPVRAVTATIGRCSPSRSR